MRKQDKSETSGQVELPPQVRNLARREREVAVIVYQQGPQTARVLEGLLGRDLSNGAIRSMLFRLCRKGILKRRKIDGSHLTTDRRIPYLYSPAIASDAIREWALEQFARDYFDGSLQLVSEALTELLGKRSGRRAPSMSSSSGQIGIAA